MIVKESIDVKLLWALDNELLVVYDKVRNEFKVLERDDYWVDARKKEVLVLDSNGKLCVFKYSVESPVFRVCRCCGYGCYVVCEVYEFGGLYLVVGYSANVYNIPGYIKYIGIVEGDKLKCIYGRDIFIGFGKEDFEEMFEPLVMKFLNGEMEDIRSLLEFGLKYEYNVELDVESLLDVNIPKKRDVCKYIANYLEKYIKDVKRIKIFGEVSKEFGRVYDYIRVILVFEDSEEMLELSEEIEKEIFKSELGNRVLVFSVFE